MNNVFYPPTAYFNRKPVLPLQITPNEDLVMVFCQTKPGDIDTRVMYIDDFLSLGGGGGYNQVEDEGVALPQRSALNFTGAGVTVVDNAGKTEIQIPGGGIQLPVERQVYLISDVAYAAAAGISNNVYTTAQAAYDAANTLQQSLGPGQKVSLIVYHTNPATVGGITLTADFNPNVSIVGLSPADSFIEFIDSSAVVLQNTYNIGSAFARVNISNITVGVISTYVFAFGPGAFKAGDIYLNLANVRINTIDSTIGGIDSTGGIIDIQEKSGGASIDYVFSIPGTYQGGYQSPLVIVAATRITIENVNPFLYQFGGRYVNGGNSLLTLINVDVLNEVQHTLISTQTATLKNCNIGYLLFDTIQEVDPLIQIIDCTFSIALQGFSETLVPRGNLSVVNTHVDQQVPSFTLLGPLGIYYINSVEVKQSSFRVTQNTFDTFSGVFGDIVDVRISNSTFDTQDTTGFIYGIYISNTAALINSFILRNSVVNMIGTPTFGVVADSPVTVDPDFTYVDNGYDPIITVI